MKDKTLILLLGLPRSGKSTFARMLSRRDGIPIVCPDAIRLALHGQRYEERAEKMVWGMAEWMVRSLFLAGHDEVLVDATNGTRKRRDFWKSRDWQRAFVVIDTSKEVCIERARMESDWEIVPVIERMATAWEPLVPEEMEPGCRDYSVRMEVLTEASPPVKE